MMFLLFILILVCLAAVFLVFFYRNPERVPPTGDVILCPADGLVIDVSEEEGWEKIVIFMNLLNVHVQWLPYPGKVVSIEKVEGPALPGYRKQAAKNKQVVTTLETGIGKIVVKQIVGILVRRIETFFRVGDSLKIGQRFGRIVFGSRVELWLPKGKVEIRIKNGQKVKAGLTVAAVPEAG